MNTEGHRCGKLGQRLVCLLGCALAVGLTGCFLPSRTARFNPYSTNAALAEMQTVTNQPPADLLKTPPEAFRLGPGDRLELELIGDPLSRALTAVGPDGKIYFHLLPGTDVWGLTLGEAKTKLQKEMANYIKDNPQISVTLRGVESQRVWLLGRFQSPGVYPMPAPMTVLEAITLAGGPVSLGANAQSGFAYNSEELADLRRAFLIRNGQRLPVDFEALLKKGDLSQNIFLQPDDFIYFPLAALREVYVLGAVAQPKAVPYNTSLTLAGAVAYANGTIKDAYLLHTALVRGSLSEPKIAIVNLKGILTGQAPDIHLEPQDIVYVPFSPYRYLAKYANLVLDTFVATVAINEGARAAVHAPTTPTGVFIPLGGSFTVTPSTSTGTTTTR